MHVCVKWCLVLIVLLVTASHAFSAPEDEIQKALDQKKFSDNLKTDLFPGESSIRGTTAPSSDMDELKALTEKNDQPVSGNQEITNAAKKPKIVLKVVPGDGQLKLSWLLVNYHQTVEEGQLKYVVSWGMDPSSLKPVEVGSADSFVIRELKNHQPYCVQVTAYKSRKKAEKILSDERFATPLPAEELSSTLENLFSKKKLTMQDKVEPEPFKRELRQFGYDFFKNSSQVLNGQDLPVSGSYALGPGDTLNLTIWGSLSARHELSIDRNGQVTIPKIGVVVVAGLSYDQARDAIDRAIARYYKNYNFNVTLGKTRTIQVFVVGEVETPGSIPISSQATLINALSAAGGPSRNGSLRNVRLMRDGKLVTEIDLYEMLLTGDRSQDVRLQNGDTILVPVIGPVAAVAGEVKRPAIYELKGKASLAEVIQMAGGITASGYTGRIQVERVANNTAKIVLDYQLKDEQKDRVLQSAEVLDRDMVKVFPVQEAVRDVVVLRGNVARAGEYQFKQGMRVKDLIGDFSDLLPESYLEAAEVTRLAAPDYHREILTFNLRKALSGDSHDNIELKEQDTIRVFSRWEMQEKPKVAINGYVMSPGAYDFYPGMTIRDLIAAAGSTKRNAILDTAELTRVVIAGDKALSTRVTLNLAKAINGDPQQNMPLQADDVLIVRGIADWVEATDKFVTLRGEVRFPGVYSVTRGERISSVIERAGGYTDKAYLKGSRFTRRSVKEIQQKRMDEVIIRTEKDILQKQAALSYVAASKEELEGTRAALEGLLKSLERLRNLKAEGRIVIRLSKLEELKKSTYDLEMEGGDIIEIPSRPNVVNVMGQVYNPTTFVHLPQTSDVGAYLSKAGGPTRDAEDSDMYIIRADGSVYSRQQSSFGIKWSDETRTWNFGSFMSTFMDPGDTLVVPQKLERTAWLRDIKDITTILSQVALTAGTVFLWFK
ncbi:SLBB domain-containing protein [Geobacter sp. SVR]|uniref:SLBB domain-containing protein n=1 Tax=Geobacter sp. SVR TaxID=2495594 RepID=UPI00143EFA04|nr:SLBB domain-containing protein [Geobacter sp. SVR]BCS53542.1 sugar ABC transporter substrate-binding protein [Geobacter sp. SVR]GCF84261.1 sugar ABC transporter substrate-binding protein [Geobacter sp. SVR]